MLSDSTYEEIAKLLNNIEESAEWPRGLQEARAVKILPCLYRRWAAARLRALAPWIEKWTLGDIYAEGEPIRTMGATYGIGLEVERLNMEGRAHYGIAVDMQKYFD